MKPHLIFLLLLASMLTAAYSRHALAQNTSSTVSSTITPSREHPASIAHSDEQQARDWGLRTDEWTRYRELMKGPLGVYSPALDPLSALGIEARSEDERRRYAELQVRAEARRVEKTLAYQRAYDAAWQRLAPGMNRVSLPGAHPADSTTAIPQNSDRTAIFVNDACPACDRAVQRLQASGTEFDIYVVGSSADDAHIREWARRTRIDPAKVRAGRITLNHDGGRWQSLGLPGELPAVIRQVDGQWQRQP